MCRARTGSTGTGHAAGAKAHPGVEGIRTGSANPQGSPQLQGDCSVSEQRNLITRFLSRQRRWVTAGIGVLGVSGLVLGGLASPSGATAVELTDKVAFSQWADVHTVWTSGDLNFSGANAGTYAEG